MRNYEKTVSLAEAVGLRRDHPSLVGLRARMHAGESQRFEMDPLTQVNALADALPISGGARGEFVRSVLRLGQAPLAALRSAQPVGEAR